MAGLGLAAWAVFGGLSDEEKIRALLDRLEQTVKVDGEENPVGRMARINGEFSEIFTKDVQVRIPELTSVGKGRQDLAGVATRAGGYFQSLDVDISVNEIGVDGTKVGARVAATATLTAVRAGGAGAERDQRNVSFRFSKDDGEWLISAVGVSDKQTRE